jgi:hypothetical protein
MPEAECRGRVLLVVNEARPTGAPRCALEDLRQLRASGYEAAVHLLESGPIQDHFQSLASVGVSVAQETPWRELTRRLRWRGSRLGSSSERRRSTSLIREIRPEAVIAHTVIAAGVARTAVELGVPTLLVVHDDPTVTRAFARAYELPSWSSDVMIVANSEATAEQLRAEVPIERLVVLHPPVQVPEPTSWNSHTESPRIRILGVGRVGRAKG